MSDLLAYLMDLTRVDCRQLKHSLKYEPVFAFILSLERGNEGDFEDL